MKMYTNYYLYLKLIKWLFLKNIVTLLCINQLMHLILHGVLNNGMQCSHLLLLIHIHSLVLSEAYKSDSQYYCYVLSMHM